MKEYLSSKHGALSWELPGLPWSCGYRSGCFRAQCLELLHTRVHDQDCITGFNVYLRLWAYEPLPKKPANYKPLLNTAKCRKGWVVLVYVAVLVFKDMLLWRHPQARSSTWDIYFYFFQCILYLPLPHSPFLNFQLHSRWVFLGQRGEQGLLSLHTSVLIVAFQIIGQKYSGLSTESKKYGPTTFGIGRLEIGTPYCDSFRILLFYEMK